MEDRETSLGRRHLSRDSKRMEEPVLRGEGKAFQTEEEVGLVLRFLRGPGVSGLRQDKGEVAEAARGAESRSLPSR